MSYSRMPDNRQIDSVLEYAVATSPVNLEKLSPEGRVLIEDARCVSYWFQLNSHLTNHRDILETARMMVAEKNSDELFQNAVYSSYSGDASRAKQSGVLPVGKDKVNDDANQGKQLCAHHP